MERNHRNPKCVPVRPSFISGTVAGYTLSADFIDRGRQPMPADCQASTTAEC